LVLSFILLPILLVELHFLDRFFPGAAAALEFRGSKSNTQGKALTSFG
jgi:hypothetical protein